MRVRNKIDDTTHQAELELQRFGDGHSQYVLFLHDSGGQPTALGSMVAAIACELIDYTRQELMALRLAGFRLPIASQKKPMLTRLTGLLRTAKQKPGRRRARTVKVGIRPGSFVERKTTGKELAHNRTHPGCREKNHHRARSATRARSSGGRIALHRAIS
ncbi:MAG TPA: hypothetical protein VKS79_26455 [Gemmataceae bacterium]|nr:hypothetical protein [Gemmataceae bacterium]